MATNHYTATLEAQIEEKSSVGFKFRSHNERKLNAIFVHKVSRSSYNGTPDGSTGQDGDPQLADGRKRFFRNGDNYNIT